MYPAYYSPHNVLFCDLATLWKLFYKLSAIVNKSILLMMYILCYVSHGQGTNIILLCGTGVLANERDDNGADGDRKNIRVFKGPSEYLEREFGKLFPCVKTFHSQYHMQRNGKP